MFTHSGRASFRLTGSGNGPNRRRTPNHGAPRRNLWHRAIVILLVMTCAGQALAQDPRVEEAVKRIDAVVARGPYLASWDSLVKYEVPDWYRDAKFGIFIHWGVYSVPAFGNEWYPRNMYIMGSPVFKLAIKIAPVDRAP